MSNTCEVYVLYTAKVLCRGKVGYRSIKCEMLVDYKVPVVMYEVKVNCDAPEIGEVSVG